MNKIVTKRNIYLLLLVIITLTLMIVIPTYAKFSSNYVTENDMVGMSLNFDIGISNIEEYNEVSVEANDVLVFNVEINNAYSEVLYYGVWYRLNDTSIKDSDFVIARLDESVSLTSDSIDSSTTKTINIVIENKTNKTIKLDIGVSSSTTSTTDIEYLVGKKLINGIYTIDRINKPNLDSGNLIPVYFDEKEGEFGSWKKADSNNTNNSWYDYNDKRWANAVIISDATKKTSYQSAAVDTVIKDSDITAFYVWIPRFKYRVWNINRQAGDESTYSYPAYSKGIQIEFEKGKTSTGNVTCNYDDQNDSSSTYLSDNCFVNGTAVMYDTNNLIYGESNPAWYTHPAFTFGDDANNDKTGFWVGKFETSGIVNKDNIVDNPKVIPDIESLRNLTISDQFMSVKKIQNYLDDSNLNSHMLTNLEWGAVAYLTHSIYGLCDGNSCSAVNNNNSNKFYTGRSSGSLVSESDSEYGTYNYKGYLLSDNIPTKTKDITQVASTTKNITGVYDMAGGSLEVVMANMVDSLDKFAINKAGNTWNNSEWYDNINTRLNNEYYNSYANLSETATKTYNVARLGDATAEVLGDIKANSAWKVGSGIVGADSIIFDSAHNWLERGSGSNGIFSFINTDGANSDRFSSRAALS